MISRVKVKPLDDADPLYLVTARKFPYKKLRTLVRGSHKVFGLRFRLLLAGWHSIMVAKI